MRLGGVNWLLAALTIGISPAAKGADEYSTPDKRSYNLLNPTPQAFLRELTTDRPDKTESPYTVDAGHFQLEMDFLSYTRDDGLERFSIAPFNLKVGLLNNVDLQVVSETYNVQRVLHRNAVSGFGDLLVRLKINFWGNDGGNTAFGVMPFVKFPTSQHGLGNQAIEGGVIFPVAVKLRGDFDLGAMTEADFVQNEAGSNYHEEFINSITLSHSIVGELLGYIEFFSAVSTSAPWVGTIDFGFTYKLTPNIQLDTGLNTGITQSADDLNPFVGLSVRY